jgi:hypothetical protein
MNSVNFNEVLTEDFLQDPVNPDLLNKKTNEKREYDDVGQTYDTFMIQGKLNLEKFQNVSLMADGADAITNLP